MNKKQIQKALKGLNNQLALKGIRGEIGVVGGAAMVLAYNARAATKDVDAIFKPSKEVRAAAKVVAKDNGLPADWLNDGVKGYMPQDSSPQTTIIEHDNLLVWVPPAEYMLAMKAISARFDSKDAEDIKILCQMLGLQDVQKILKIVEGYYPKKMIPPKTKFFLEELLIEATSFKT